MQGFPDRQGGGAALALLTDLGRDLHDAVIQDLFIAGMALQSVTHTKPGGATEQRIAAATAHLDHAITLIRAAAFDIEASAATAWPGSPVSCREVATALSGDGVELPIALE